MFLFLLSLYIPTLQKDIIERCVKEELNPSEREKCKDALFDWIIKDQKFYLLDPFKQNQAPYRPPIQILPPQPLFYLQP